MPRALLPCPKIPVPIMDPVVETVTPEAIFSPLAPAVELFPPEIVLKTKLLTAVRFALKLTPILPVVLPWLPAQLEKVIVFEVPGVHAEAQLTP